MTTLLVVVMGVSGSGKSTVGQHLAASLGQVGGVTKALFLDADDYHPETNKLKMCRGIPLTDSDRIPWLSELRQTVRNIASESNNTATTTVIVLACSALRRMYRQLIVDRQEGQQPLLYNTVFVYLKCSKDLLEQRLAARNGHFFNPALLSSQLSALEEPDPRLEPANSAVITV
ncbi:hypothetical protein EV182_004253, partial [Spiromyces aspiralis]